MAAKLPNLEPYIMAGIDPKTKLPYRAANKCLLKQELKKAIRIVDEQDAVNRYTWYNLPGGITSQELERMLYYKGQLCFFYDEDLEQFYFMPYALSGTIDYYGRFNYIHPVPFSGGQEDNKAQADFLSNKILKVKYDMDFSFDWDVLSKSTVLLHDYTKQLSQTIIPRVSINEAVIDAEAELYPLARTALIANTGVRGVRVQDEDQANNIIDANRIIEDAALTGHPYVPVVGTIEMQELGDGNIAKSEEFLLTMQSLDNFRLGLYGIDNGGIFEKKSQVLQSEFDINGGTVGLVLQDGLTIRQNFCNIVNSIWGLGIWCEPAENIVQMDINGDGALYNRDTPDMGSGDNNSMEVNTDDEI